ncbi:type II toxin-antitoxin system ParD family antitoxin [Tomitella fengzijianii]|uniref:type II toxin-antitoxin system ParD family antitoxin n=1 Tax=Tomitella fengzijianii TaxID=2597660 RepID=UPI00131B8610|nr:type II toxin-antitoxin system ParD family antitoxin [Tomitella fengzijianii]
MATYTSTTLDDHCAAFLADQVGTGRYRSASEVVRAGLRLPGTASICSVRAW